MKYKNLYDELYNEGYHNNPKASHTKTIYELIHKYVNKHSKILDIGCSNGTGMLDLEKNGYDMYGIDIADKAIDICNARKLKNCKVNSVTSIDFQDKYFDAIISTDVLEHLDPSEIKPAISECKRILKQNGIGIFVIATIPERSKVWQYIARQHDLKNLHTSIFNSNYWENEIISQGLEIIYKKNIPKRGVVFIFNK